MDREISKEVRQKEQRKQFIKLGAGIGIAAVSYTHLTLPTIA